MKKSLLILTPIVLTGCVSMGPPDGYTGPPLYSNDEPIRVESINIETIKETQEQLYLSIGSDKTGFIQPDRSEARIIFEKKFPISIPRKSKLNDLTSHNHNMRAGQAISYGIDFDPRTSGFLKDENNHPISITGSVSFIPGNAIMQGMSSGVTSGALLGTMSVNAINQDAAQLGMQLSTEGTTKIMASQMLTGAVAGIIAGSIHASMAGTAIEEISKASHYGERVEGTTLVAAHVMKGASPINSYGKMNTRTPPVFIKNGIVKRVFALSKVDDDSTDKKIRFIVVSTIGTYRGLDFENKYPYTDGWEYRVTNLNQILLPADSISAWDGQISFENLMEELSASKIKI